MMRRNNNYSGSSGQVGKSNVFRRALNRMASSNAFNTEAGLLAPPLTGGKGRMTHLTSARSRGASSVSYASSSVSLTTFSKNGKKKRGTRPKADGMYSPTTTVHLRKRPVSKLPTALVTNLNSSKMGLSKRSPMREDRGSIYAEFSFSALNLDEDNLIDAACEMVLDSYVQLGKEAKKLAKNRSTDLSHAIREFVTKVASLYTDSNFHNFTHAVDVTQLMYTFIKKYFKNRLKREEKFYLLISCLCHDISHPGASTNFLRKNKCLHEEDSLEQYHISQTLNLIDQFDLKLFSAPFLKPAQKEELMKYAKYLIEATDISQDKRYRTLAKDATCAQGDKLPMEYLAILIKISDLANVVRDFEDAHSWSQSLKVETLAEGRFTKLNELKQQLDDSEEPEAIPATFDSDYDQRMGKVQQELSHIQERVLKSDGSTLHIGLADSTTSFINMIVKPLSILLYTICEDAGADYGNRLRSNLLSWREVERR